jgi:hypothetical protein
MGERLTRRVQGIKRAATTATVSVVIGAGSLILPPFYVPPPVRIAGQNTKEERGRWPEAKVPKLRPQVVGHSGRRR